MRRLALLSRLWDIFWAFNEHSNFHIASEVHTFGDLILLNVPRFKA